MTHLSSLSRAVAAVLLAATATAQAQTYCPPSYSTACTVGGDYIQSVSTTGGTTNITNNNTGCNGNANNYQYYSTQSVTVPVGGSFAFSFTNSGTQQYYKIWVDWNNNLSFTDPGEEMYSSGSAVNINAIVTATITAPITAGSGTKRMRIRSQGITTTVTPCSTAFYGETEDYNVVLQGAPCNGAPGVGTVYTNPASACASSLIILIASGYTTAAGIQLQWHSSLAPAGPYTNIPGATMNNAVVTQTVPTYYRLKVTCTNSMIDSISNWDYVPMSTSCQDSVWPGDANYDLVANNLDMLALTFSWGVSGSTRTGASNAWTPQFAMNWPQAFANGVNKKNVDCNGDGVVGWADTVAIVQNYGLMHLKGADEESPSEKTAGLPDLFVDLTGLAMTPGTTITAPIRFGSAASPVTKIYGVAATVKMSGTATVGAPSVAMTPTWMGTPAQVLRFAKTTGGTTADFFASRITRRDTTGYGTLGTVSFAIPSSATGKVKVSLQNVTVIDSNGTPLTGAFNVLADSANVLSTGIVNASNNLSSAAILPNPGAAPVLELHLSKSAAVDVVVMDALGKQVWRTSGHAGAGTQRIALPGVVLPAGIYSVRLLTDSGAETETLRWIKP